MSAADVAGVAEDAFFHRASDDAELKAILGDGARVVPGWPTVAEAPANYPLVSFYVFGPPPIAPGVQRVRITTDAWVWPTGLTGGRAKAREVDARLMELFDEQHFAYDGFRFYSVAGSFRDFPAAPGEPMRRLREFTLNAWPA